MKLLTLKSIILLLAFAVTWALSFLLTMLGLQRIPYATLIALRVLVAAAFLLPLAIRPTLRLRLNRSDWLDFSLLALFGVVLAQLFQVIYRYSYAPPASDVSFLLNLAPVFIVLLSALVLSEEISLAKMVGMGAAVLGMVSILANWERPSTFSPLSRYPREEMVILLAAFCWGLFTVHARKLLRRHNPLTATFLTLGLGSVPLLILALAKDGLGVVFSIPPADWVTVILLGIICTAVSYLLWFQALTRTEASEAGAVLFITPVLLTSLVGIERRIGFFGTNPIIITPVIIGSLLTVAGVYVTWAGWMRGWKEAESAGQGVSRYRWPKRVLVFLAASSLFVAIVAFFFPVKVNYVQGILLNDALYESRWQTNAFETIGGYLIVLTGIVNLSAALRYLKGRYGALQLMGWSAFSGLLLLSARLAGNTVFLSWMSWIPAEIQHAIGTEYVRVWEAAVTSVPMLISLFLGVAYVGIAVLLGCMNIVTARRERRAASQ